VNTQIGFFRTGTVLWCWVRVRVRVRVGLGPNPPDRYSAVVLLTRCIPAACVAEGEVEGLTQRLGAHKAEVEPAHSPKASPAQQDSYEVRFKGLGTCEKQSSRREVRRSCAPCRHSRPAT
jgi:hypothetical protein